MRWINLASAAAILLASAGIAHAGKYTVINKTDKSVWISVYNGLGRGLFAQCLLAGNSVSGSILTGEILYVRGELKESHNSCVAKTLSDTGKGPPIIIGKDTVKFFQAHQSKLYLR